MEITARALLTLIHGMLFGAFFLMCIFGFTVEIIRSAHAEQPSPLMHRPPGMSMSKPYWV